mgnify:FL=1
MVGLRYKPWYVRGYPDMVRYMYDLKKGPSCNMEGITKDSDKSSSG